MFSKFEQVVQGIVQHYNPKKYWKYRQKIISNQGSRIINIIRLGYIKRCDAFNNASMGTHLGYGAQFASTPSFPHGLNGIIVSHNAIVGENCRIFHQVTIGEGRGGAPTIGNNVLLGAGSKIIGGVHLGNNVKIAAGCVVMEDIPDNAVVLPGENRTVIKEQ